MNKAAIMQPYFFPYIGYYALMHYAGTLIFFDTPQYDRKGWMSRNRILKPGRNDWQYIKVSTIKTGRFSPISDVFLPQDEKWKERILSQLEHYKKVAPYFYETRSLVEAVLSESGSKLLDICYLSCSTVCDYIGLKVDFKIYSELDLQLADSTFPGEWALKICEALKIGEYINPPGGKEIFNTEDWNDRKIQIKFLHHTLPTYKQRNKEFIPGLSIVDIMMFNSPNQILSMIQEYKVSSS